MERSDEERIIAESLSVCTKFVALKNKICFIIKKKKKESGDIINVQIATINEAQIHIYYYELIDVRTHTHACTDLHVAWRLNTKNVDATNLRSTTSASFTITIENVKRRRMSFIWLECSTFTHTHISVK